MWQACNQRAETWQGDEEALVTAEASIVALAPRQSSLPLLVETPPSNAICAALGRCAGGIKSGRCSCATFGRRTLLRR